MTVEVELLVLDPHRIVQIELTVGQLLPGTQVSPRSLRPARRGADQRCSHRAPSRCPAQGSSTHAAAGWGFRCRGNSRQGPAEPLHMPMLGASTTHRKPIVPNHNKFPRLAFAHAECPGDNYRLPALVPTQRFVRTRKFPKWRWEFMTAQALLVAGSRSRRNIARLSAAYQRQPRWKPRPVITAEVPVTTAGSRRPVPTAAVPNRRPNRSPPRWGPRRSSPTGTEAGAGPRLSARAPIATHGSTRRQHRCDALQSNSHYGTSFDCLCNYPSRFARPSGRRRYPLTTHLAPPC